MPIAAVSPSTASGVVERHRLAAVAVLVEQELVDLAAALAAIAAQPLDDPLQRIGFDGEPVRPRRALDQPLEGGFVVHVAGQGRQAVLGLGQRAQARARREVAALHHDQRVAGGRPPPGSRAPPPTPRRPAGRGSRAARPSATSPRTRRPAAHGSPFSTSPAISTTRNGSLRSSHTVRRVAPPAPAIRPSSLP